MSATRRQLKWVGDLIELIERHESAGPAYIVGTITVATGDGAQFVGQVVQENDEWVFRTDAPR